MQRQFFSLGKPSWYAGPNVLLPPYENTVTYSRSSRQEVFLRKSVLKICSKFTWEHPCRRVISIKLLCNFIEIALRHRCSLVSLLRSFRTPFPRNISGWLLLNNWVKTFVIQNSLSEYPLNLSFQVLFGAFRH